MSKQQQTENEIRNEWFRNLQSSIYVYIVEVIKMDEMVSHRRRVKYKQNLSRNKGEGEK